MPKSTNDKKVLSLQKKVEEKKAALAKAQRFSPITNCSLAFEGERYNLNTLDVRGCTIMAVRINSMLMSAKDLKIEEPVVISGYSLDDWKKDLMAKLAHLQREVEKKKLQKMQESLKVLLSEDTRTELAIGDLEKQLS